MRRCRADVGRGEEGLTLVELLISMVILGILFSGLAMALVNLARASVQSERQVQGTALSQSLHEQFQAIPWDRASLYENEVATLPGDATFLDLTEISSGTFEGRPLVVRDAWPSGSCTDDPYECGRLFFVPKPYEAAVEVGGREYEVVRIVTEAPAANALRFTTFVRTEVAGRTLEQRVDSERAATPGELAELEREGVLQYLVAPQGIRLDDEGTPVGVSEVTIAARFDRAIQADSVTVTYEVLVEDSEGSLSPETREIDLPTDFTVDDGSGYAAFWYAGVPSDFSSERPNLEDGERWVFELKARAIDGTPYETSTDVFVGDDGVYPDDPPILTDLTVGPSSTLQEIEVGIGPNAIEPAALCDDFTVGVDATDNSSVLLYYTGISSQSRPMLDVSSAVDDLDNYSVTFSAGAPSQWTPTTGLPVTERFLALAVDDQGRSSSLVRSAPYETYTFTRVPGGGVCTP